MTNGTDASKDPFALFRNAALTFSNIPAIYQRHRPGSPNVSHYLSHVLCAASNDPTCWVQPTDLQLPLAHTLHVRDRHAEECAAVLLLGPCPCKPISFACMAQVVAHQVPDWRMVKQNRHQPPHRQIWDNKEIGNDRSSPKTSKVNKAKGLSSGRTYTSKYRGVHQTFPTRRWEAQFRCDIIFIQCIP